MNTTSQRAAELDQMILSYADRASVVGPCRRVPLAIAAALLPSLGEKYPKGYDWLERRIAEANSGRARVWLASSYGRPIALAIETAKGMHRSKLSTFVVDPRSRGRSVGSNLLEALRRDWANRDITDVNVTVDYADQATKRFFQHNGFLLLPNTVIPYGPNSRDALLRWKAEFDPLINASSIH